MQFEMTYHKEAHTIAAGFTVDVTALQVVAAMAPSPLDVVPNQLIFSESFEGIDAREYTSCKCASPSHRHQSHSKLFQRCHDASTINTPARQI
jgi:hypothetical protein